MDDKQIFDNWETFKALLKKTGRPVENLIKWLDESDFKFAPASTQYHNCFRGGLLKHSLDVYYQMYDFSNFISFFEIPEESIIIASLLHDICKVNCYDVSYRNTKNEDGEWVKVPYYTFNAQENLGHGAKSVMLMYEYDLKPTKLERAMIVNHMGFSVEGNKMEISKLFNQCPQALILHWADEASTWISESDGLQDRFRQRLTGRNISESLQINKQIQQSNSSQPNQNARHIEQPTYPQESSEVTIQGTKYKVAPENAIVDGEKIIEVTITNSQGLPINVKVYTPHGDGLPF